MEILLTTKVSKTFQIVILFQEDSQSFKKQNQPQKERKIDSGKEGCDK